MIVARVTGDVVATVKHPALSGDKLLLVQPIAADGTAIGKSTIAVDSVSAGLGDTVLVVDEGNSAGQVLNRPRGPIRTVIVGVVDSWGPDGESGG